MNGRPHLDLFTLAPPAAMPGGGRLRLAAALAISGLLHAAAVLVPSPEGRSVSPAAAPGLEVILRAPDPGPSHAPEPQRARAVHGKPPAQQALSTSTRPPGAPLLPIPASYFYTAEQLTKHARPMSRPRFDLPETSPMFTTGRVILKVWIDALGNVVAVEVESSEVPDAVSAAAARAFRELSFSPGEIRGRRVASVMRIEVIYLDGNRTIQVISVPR